MPVCKPRHYSDCIETVIGISDCRIKTDRIVKSPLEVLVLLQPVYQAI
jgi:hypothetical protein